MHAALTTYRHWNILLQQQHIHHQKPFDYIEIMACPKGCLNGGGQISQKWETMKIQQGEEEEVKAPVVMTPAQTREKVNQSLFFMTEMRNAIPTTTTTIQTSTSLRTHNSLMKWLYSPSMLWEHGGGNPNSKFNDLMIVDDESNNEGKEKDHQPFGDKARQMLHTRFYHVPKLELSMGATAGVAVDTIKW